MRTISFAAAFVLMAGAAAAQPAGDLVITFPAQWTAPGTEETTRQQNVAGSAAFDVLFAGERGRAFYEMTVETFATTDALKTWLHNGGMTMTFGSDTRAIDLGGSVFFRANEGTWADAGFKGVNLVANLRGKPSEFLTVNGSYAFYARSLADQPALDQLEHHGSARVLANLQTRTTLIGLVSIGRKSYDGREIVLVAGDAAAPLPDHTGIPVGTGRGGWRQLFMAPLQVEFAGEPGARTQWSWAARLAQSLDDRTGIWIEREERRTAGDLPPAIVWTPPLFYEDGVYDDPYVIDAKTWRAGAKHIFASGSELGGWVSYSDRSYAGLAREDTLTRAGAEGVIPLLKRAKTSLDFLANYSFFENSSSDVLESYRAHQVSAGLRVGF